MKTTSTAPNQPENPTPVMLITGATRGIGHELAICAAADGVVLWLVARNKLQLEDTASALRTRFGTEVHVQAIDLACPGSSSEIAKAVAARGCYVKFLVNNAGMGLSGPFASSDQEALGRLIDLNIKSLGEMCHTFLPDMLVRREGGILNIASLGGLVPGPHQAAYYASKSYVVSLTRAMAFECWGKRVRISVLLPGPVTTGFHEDMKADKALYLRLLPQLSAARAARIGYRSFLCGRTMIVPGLINQLLALLMSFLPGFITLPLISFLLKRR